MAEGHADWIARVRDAFAAARRDGDPVLAEVFPFQVRLRGRLVDAQVARRRAVWAATCEQIWLLSKVGFVVVLVAWLMLAWPHVTLLAAAGTVPAAWLLLRWSRTRVRDAEGWLDAAEVAPGALIAAHESLRRTGTGAAPARFLVSFDPRLGADPEGLAAAAQACSELAGRSSALEGGEAALRDWLRDSETAQRFDRVAVPETLCGARDTFAVGAVVYRHQLASGRIDRAIYPLALRRMVDEPADMLPAALWAPAAG